MIQSNSYDARNVGKHVVGSYTGNTALATPPKYNNNNMVNVNNYICLYCANIFSTLKNEKEIIKCPTCGSHKVGKQEYNQVRIKIDNPNRWRYCGMESSHQYSTRC